jgi:hypothetical protein
MHNFMGKTMAHWSTWINKYDGLKMALLCGLFNDAVNSSLYNVGWLMNDELERIWKEAVVTSFNVIPRHFPGWNKENLSQDCRSQGWHSNPGPPEHETEVLTTRLQHLIWRC